MCGRTSCTLRADVLAHACSTVTRNGKVPSWAGNDPGYEVSTNIVPTSYTPVLTIRSGSNDDDKPEETLQSMMWGFIPPWYKGSDPTKHGLSTNNARLESLSQSKLYKGALTKGHRCVVMCDGFYEWQSVNNGRGKQPYIVYASTNNHGVSNQSQVGVDQVWKEERGGSEYDGQLPLFMAGIYTKWTAPGEEKDKDARSVFSYAVMTRESEGVLDWLHKRMPVILPDKDAVLNWLDPQVKGEDALNQLKQIDKSRLSFHPVARAVGNSKEKNASLMERVELDQNGLARDQGTKRSASLMANWLAKKKPNSEGK